MTTLWLLLELANLIVFTLVIISCSLVYITRLPMWLSALGLICCFYIVGFLIMAALREDRQLVQA
ncbi:MULTISPECIES: hypothetical protein [Citrobacter freundii complex]|uniref:hypothetical protein n=1 Tax=Citrobacter freundii complex TaxID=1344959 RepID=UPI0006BCA89C|nr:hypothetical protein [Citrobacter portucalensis]ALD75589.1 hypothetical protein P10159_0766 [Citrobacter portucalensis]MBD9986462.1 hypothetical protein [Citrobacter portucalensis]MBE0035771.1 hypothetical protein [Citrobacter portucalensis]MBE0037190.1 hypothetical protein [Citrobacter portucalensis]MBE0046408.1 hypothetical protein [Citrobacter portucalensis]